MKIYGMLRIRNEEKIIHDTLEHMNKFCTGGIYIYDDCSTDNTVSICNKFENIKIYLGNNWKSNRELSETIERQFLLEEIKKNATKDDWIVCLDADERVEFDWNILEKLTDDYIAVKMKLFDYYITSEDVNKNYKERNYVGPEYREIIIAFKNLETLKFSEPIQREVSLNSEGKILNQGFVKHYGKAISVEDWEKKCNYYSSFFPTLSSKWENRKGKAVHNGYSDFGNKLIKWEEKETKGFPLVEETNNQTFQKLRILITNHHLLDFRGTEVYTILIATELKKLGHEVYIYSKYISDEIKKIFGSNLIHLVEHIEALKNIKFDLAHVHHNINAIEVRNTFKELPIVFVVHGILPYLEQPPFIELNITKYVAVSEEVKEYLSNNYKIDESSIEIIQNPIDSEVFYSKNPVNDKPQKALIFSNKISESKISIIKNACKKLDIELTIIDQNKKIDQANVRDEILKSDIVFSLGRGALESMFCERAVIIFDIHGGDGMVTSDNFFEIMKHNFSGRRFKINYDENLLIEEIKKFNKQEIIKVKELVVKYFAKNKIISDLINIYKYAISNFEINKINDHSISNICNIINEVNYYTDYNAKRKLSYQYFDLADKKNIKIKIGYLSVNFKSSCQYLRVTSVLNELYKLNLIEFINIINIEKFITTNNLLNSINKESLNQIDILIVQRETAELIPFIKLKKLINNRTKIIYEIDDNLINLYPKHPLYNLYKNKKDHYIDYLSNADLITVTTKNLRDEFSIYNKNISILPNYINTRIIKNNIDKKVNLKIKILFSGSKTHLTDLQVIEKAIIEIYKKYKDKVEFIFWGDITENIEKNCQYTKIDKFFNKYEEYLLYLSTLNVDIGLIPLEDNNFNKSKSNIKWLDYSAVGIASILSDVEAYNSSVINNMNGLLVKNNIDDWIFAIEDLIKNDSKRKMISENAREIVMSEYSLNKNILKWYYVYKNLLEIQKTKRISVIVPLFNSVKYTIEFVDSFFSNLPKKYKYELILIDNFSQDETKNYLMKITNRYKNVEVIFNDKNYGFPVAVNQGITEAIGDFILIANNDIVFTNNSIDRMIEIAESDPMIGIVGPISNEVSGLQKDNNANYKSIDEMHNYANKVREKNQGQVLQFPRVAFLCTLVKKDVIEKIGGLDERFSPGNYEDDDFCLRAQLAGYKTVIAKDVFIHHYGSKSFKANGLHEYQKRLDINRQKFIDKWNATPEEIWIENKKIKDRQIYFPINKDLFKQYFERTRIHLADNELTLAEESIVKAIENFNEEYLQLIKYDELLNLAGNIFLAIGNLQSAQKYFEQELQTNPQSSSACFGLGQIFLNYENYDAAKTMFEWAIKNDETNLKAKESLQNVNEILGLDINHNSLVEM